MSEVSVLLVDDHAIVRTALRTYLELQDRICVVGEAGDGSEAVTLASQLQPDVVVMDLSMPGMGGVEATRAIKLAQPDTKVLVLTSLAGDTHLMPVIRAGASAYLSKDSDSATLTESIRAVHRGEYLLAPELARVLRHDRAAVEGTLTIVFSDVEGFTQMTERLGDEATFNLMKIHHDVVRRNVRKFAGQEVELMGDGFLLSFPAPLEAVACSVAIQRELARYSELHPDRPIRVHVGIHTGSVLEEEGRYFGRTVIMASRISAVAKGTEILLSEAAAKGAGDQGPFLVREPQMLKGVAEPQVLYEVVWQGAPG